MNGTITITRGGTVTIHTYTSPPEGWLVNTQILEGPTKLIIFDGQLVRAYADEAVRLSERKADELADVVRGDRLERLPGTDRVE